MFFVRRRVFVFSFLFLKLLNVFYSLTVYYFIVELVGCKDGSKTDDF